MALRIRGTEALLVAVVMLYSWCYVADFQLRLSQWQYSDNPITFACAAKFPELFDNDFVANNQLSVWRRFALGASMQMLRPGERTKAHRHTGSYLYHVAKGSGHSIINGKRFDWNEHDIFCVPSWAWHEHANASDRDDAVLFCLNDLPVMRAMGLFREQAFGENGGHQPVL